jgi:hypothetical protein
MGKKRFRMLVLGGLLLMIAASATADELGCGIFGYCENDNSCSGDFFIGTGGCGIDCYTGNIFDPNTWALQGSAMCTLRG